ncbi:MAG: hypothetical protein RLZZ623_3686 [Actinomycetota bacterium]
MEGWSLAAVGLVLVGFALVSRRVSGTIVTPAMVFVGIGLVLGNAGFDLFGSGLSLEGIRRLAEATLALVLFADASGIDTRSLRREAAMPVRLLAIGLPLTIVFGSLVAAVLFADLSIWEAVVLAVLLAPTDAALGQTVVADERLPSALRQGLNVESGLNDGVCVPLLFGAIAIASIDQALDSQSSILGDLVKELLIAASVGVAVAVVVAFGWRIADKHQSISGQWAQVVPLAAAMIAYTATDELGGSGFIACFVAGLLFGRLVGPTRDTVIHLTEELGGVLSAATFFMFAAVLAGPAFEHLDVTTVIYAVLSLTVARMLPVALSLVRAGTTWQTKAFAGWFGPRGLASIVFGLTVVLESGLHGYQRIIDVTTITVILSVLLHGVTAPPLTNRYIGWLRSSVKPQSLDDVGTTPQPQG